jgi:hypothetical protein
LGYITPPVPVIDDLAPSCAKYRLPRFVWQSAPKDVANRNKLTMNTLTPLAKLTIPVGGQVIELQQLDYEAGGMSLLRTRIREKSRFTVFDIDSQSAQFWGEALIRWAQSQPVATPDLQDPA